MLISHTSTGKKIHGITQNDAISTPCHLKKLGKDVKELELFTKSTFDQTTVIKQPSTILACVQQRS